MRLRQDTKATSVRGCSQTSTGISSWDISSGMRRRTARVAASSTTMFRYARWTSTMPRPPSANTGPNGFPPCERAWQSKQAWCASACTRACTTPTDSGNVGSVRWNSATAAGSVCTGSGFRYPVGGKGAA